MQKWVKWFANKGHDVHLITDYSADIHGVTLYQIGNKKRDNVFNFLQKIRQTRKLIKKIKPDILHAHYAFGYGTFGAFSLFHPFVISPWGSDILIETDKSKLIKILVKFALKKADLITCDGDNTIEKMIQLGIDSKKIHRIYHGIDPLQFSPTQNKEQLRKKMGLSNNPTIISTRHLDPLYDVETVIRSAPFVLEKQPTAQFIIAGDIVSSPPEQKKFLQDLAKTLKVSANVRFTGSLSHDELPLYLASADVYVSTSLSDGGIALSTLEAMACETAPVVTDVANNRKWIRDGENGFVVPIKDPKTLADRIVYLIEHDSIRKKFGEISRKIVEEEQNYDKEMAKAENLCLKLLKDNKSNLCNHQ